MRSLVKVFLTGVGLVVMLIASVTVASAGERGSLIDFESMIPVTGVAVGAVNDRGIKGGGLPWAITSGEGSVSKNGTVDVRVTGLVIPVPPLNGTNPVPFFKATVSCLNHHKVVNTSTGSFPANLAGDSHIHARITLPRHCQSPILFVVAPTGQWFAQSNLDLDDD
ncbi:MAG TPA: hypothetical protein VLR46_15305 [Candidatus Dormibacteraeota bacterium]|nr:hypothetical protein [Candidatus Dormibacteraeota bacterium]